MSKNIYVSVLMPIYNASKYLEQSLTSALQQSLSEIEIICINDGSTDNSLDIIKKYTRDDKRITVIDKTNSGYGDSMNSGLKIAKGEYVAILEPDDWYEPNMLKTLYQLATKHNLDVVKGDFYQYSNQTKQDRQYHLFEPEQCDKIFDSSQDTFIYYLQPSIWSAIYKRKFLTRNNISFLDTPGASYQDTSFNFKVFATARRAMFVNKPLLHYRIDNSQSSINNIAKKLPYIDKEYDEIDHFIKEKCNNSVQLRGIANSCRFLTYLWAMEQLDGKSLRNYILHIRNTLSKIGIHQYSGLSDNQRKNLNRIIEHPNQYYLFKQFRLKLHRFKYLLGFTR